MRARFFVILACAFMFASSSAVQAGGERFKFGTDPEIGQVRPAKPVSIKLKRNASGKYSWEISGDSVRDVTEADRELREYLKIKDTR